MALINRAERSSHWYHRDGTPCHTVIAKSTGLPRPTIVTDARKLDLVPSVTNILAIKAKPALITWMQDNAIMAALNTPRNPGEAESDWHTRIAEESERIGREAAEWGELLHEQCEQRNTLGCFMGKGEILDYVAGYDEWFRENVVEVIAAEDKIVHPLGFAGRRDLKAIIRHEGRERLAIIDFKSQKLKSKPKGTFYKEWPMQLAAYADNDRDAAGNLPLLVSLIIPSDRPDKVQAKVWDNGEQAWQAFKHAFGLWCYEKDYTPTPR